MKKKAKQQYLKEGGKGCIHCNSTDLKCQPPVTDDSTIQQKVRCCSCGKTWLDVYTLTDVLIEN